MIVSTAVTMRSFAKINLGLRIGALREDGFHQLLTVYQTIGLHDVIRVSVERGSGIEIQCADPRVPRDESNTCFRIAELAMAELGAKGRVIIEIDKRLPVQGGLGGASANAVATLLGLERALRKTLPAAEKLHIAAQVGSDLPLFLVGGTVLGVGRGEQVYPLADLPAMACVVVTPEVGVSTPKAFAAWDRICGGSQQEPAELRSARPGQRPGPTQSKQGADAALKRRSSTVPGKTARENTAPAKLTALQASDRMNELGRRLSAWLSEMHSSAPFDRSRQGGRAENSLLWLVRAGIQNDFEEVVFPEYPELGKVKRALVRAGAKYASLSGSGSTLYGLFASQEAAAQAGGELQKQGWAARATVSLTRQQYWRRVVVG